MTFDERRENLLFWRSEVRILEGQVAAGDATEDDLRFARLALTEAIAEWEGR